MRTQRGWTGYAWAAGASVACTFAGLAMRPRFDLVNIAMVYLLAVVVIALRYNRGAAILVAALCVAAFDFIFVPPRGTFTVDDVQYLLTFVIMMAVGLVISGLVADVRRQAKSQAALEVQAETERIRGALLASISHDLRTPLAIITGISSSLAERGERLGAEERATLAQSLYRQARDMSEQVTKVLQMTRLESGTIALSRDWVALSEIVESVIGRLGERLASHRLIVEVPTELPLVRVDAALIEQALGNLLENAARHTPPGTLVQLRVERNNAEVVVSVEDFGPGLPESDLERIFGKFSRPGGESTSGGVGLGLAICRAIVRLHGGRAWAEQLAGGFTAFRFSLPLEPAPAVPVEEPE